MGQKGIDMEFSIWHSLKKAVVKQYASLLHPNINKLVGAKTASKLIRAHRAFTNEGPLWKVFDFLDTRIQGEQADLCRTLRPLWSGLGHSVRLFIYNKQTNKEGQRQGGQFWNLTTITLNSTLNPTGIISNITNPLEVAQKKFLVLSPCHSLYRLSRCG
ncbi:unnamed protein product [Dovyalis caffra]|uniref:Uncharacterized protein n=1 Tax=Dovyalis caffra TaxID=77055 RepID=A0AAV1RA49_9ROSI|nr:unnamed protein product [Dovyalis caffra]